MATLRFRVPTLVALAATVSLLAAACVPDTQLPSGCGQPTVSFTATLADGRLEPGTLEVCRDQQVAITVTIEQDGVLHLHGYDDRLGAQPVTAGEEVELSFIAAHVGQFPIALHPVEGPAELTVGTLIVHDA